MTERWPMDMSSLEIGSLITRDKLASVFPGVDPGSSEWRFAMMGLARQIRAEFRRRDEPRRVVVIEEYGGLLICDDRRAARVTQKRSKRHWRGVKRAFKDAVDVRLAALPDDERAEHEQHVLREGRRLQAAASASKRAAIAPSRGVAPGLPAPDDGGAQ